MPTKVCVNTKAILLTVYLNGVLSRVDGRQIGFFRDEVEAVSASLEHLILRSSDYAPMRRCPPFVVIRKRAEVTSPLTPCSYRRAMLWRWHPERWVRRPCASLHEWLA